MGTEAKHSLKYIWSITFGQQKNKLQIWKDRKWSQSFHFWVDYFFKWYAANDQFKMFHMGSNMEDPGPQNHL